MFKLTLKGNKAVLQGLEKVGDKARKAIAQEIEASALDIEAGAKARAPKDQGFLQGGIHVQPDYKNLRARIESRMHYSPYVEFGTGGLVDVPAGLEDYAMQFKGKDIKQVNLPARPFLFPSFEQERPKLIKNIERVLKDSTK